MLRHHRIWSRSAVALTVTFCLVTAACGDDANEDANEDANAAETEASPTTTTDCPGEPLRFTTFASETGPVSFPSVRAETRDGYKAALQAVNAECALGRPLDIAICDDKSDPNESAKCGRTAASDGTIALFGHTGLFDAGTAAADLPGVLTQGQTPFDLTDERSFSPISGLTLVMAGVSVAAAEGAESILMVSLDSSATRPFVGVSREIAAGLGLEMEPLWVPPETTDYAPVAAQIAERDPDAIVLILNSMVPFMNALDAVGISPRDVPIMTGVTLFPPETIEELGAKAEGMYLLSQAAPPSDTDNPGIAQMLEELEAAGVDAQPEELSPAITTAWSNVHILVDILQDLPEADLATLDSAKLVELFSGVGPVSRPEYTPFDFTTTAYPDIKALASLRLFSRQAMVITVEDGTYQAVSPFGDVTQPFEL